MLTGNKEREKKKKHKIMTAITGNTKTKHELKKLQTRDTCDLQFFFFFYCAEIHMHGTIYFTVYSHVKEKFIYVHIQFSFLICFKNATQECTDE